MKQKNYIAFGWCILVAFLLLLICSRSSFLYPCNDWNDANSYFTMGKALLNGQILYRDLYDQKGPYLYLLYGIAYLLSHTSFAGVFVLEILAVGTFLFAGYRTLLLYCSERISFLAVPLMGAVVLASKSFYWGGAAEEFCLPLLGISFYYSLKYFKEQFPKEPSLKMILANGIFAGIVMQVKYTLLGFYFAWMAMMVLAYLMGKGFKDIRKGLKGMLKGCFVFLGGMLVTAIPWLLFFGINGALDDWYQCYIYNNVFLYSNLSEEGNGLGNRIYTLAKLLYWLIRDNLSYFFCIIAGFVLFLLSFKNRWYEKLNILALWSFLFLGIYFGGSNLPYYAIPLMTFSVLGFAMIGRLLEKLFGKLFTKRNVKEINKVIPILAAILLVCAGMGFCYGTSMNTYFMKQDRESYFLYKYKDIINQEENPTLVTIGCLDAGLYTVADVMPSCKFFQTNGINFQKMYDEQGEYVAEGKTQFILARDDYPESIWNHYELVGEEPYQWSGLDFTYYLFKRKGLQ